MSKLKKYTAQFMKEKIIKPYMKEKGYPDKLIDSVEVIFHE